MRKGKFVILSLIIALAVGSIIYYYNPFLTRTKPLIAVSHPPVIIGQDERIHFFLNGFAVSGETTKFYNRTASEIAFPFSEEDLEQLNNNITINESTENYMLVNDLYIYNSSVTPFEKVFEIWEGQGWSIKEYDNFLLFSIINDQNKIKPYILILDNGQVLDFSNIKDFIFIGGHYNNSAKSLSLLNMSLDASFPSSRVFHYSNYNNLYGAIAVDDQSFYRIFRLPSHVILIGIHQLLCYNIDGILEWSVESPKSYQLQSVETDLGLLFYFDNPVVGENNTLYVDNEARQKWITFPKGLSNLQSYMNGFIATQFNRRILIMNKGGNVTESYDLANGVSRLFWLNNDSEYIYVVDQNQQLGIFSNNREDESS